MIFQNRMAAAVVAAAAAAVGTAEVSLAVEAKEPLKLGLQLSAPTYQSGL